MDMREFFSLLWPEGGYKFVATLNKYFKHYPVQTAEEAGDLADSLDKAGNGAVYFSCASYSQPVVVDEQGEKSWRTQENACSAKCFWQDLDVGEGSAKKYASKQEALDRLREFVDKAKLPAPLLVSSGNGVHVYWPLTESVPKDQWVKVATAMRRVMRHYGMKSDPARDKDIASVLRPIGTFNRKDPANPKAVEVIEPGDGPTNTKAFIAAVVVAYKGIAGAAEAPSKLPEVPAYLRQPSEGPSAFSAGIDTAYPPAHFKAVVLHCKQAAHFSETGGDSEPTWRAMAGLAKHCVEGAPLFHEISKRYDGYSRNEAQTKLDGWKLGPPTCELMDNEGDRCKGCPHKGKIKSPIQLGGVLPEKPETVIVGASDEDDDEAEEAASTPTTIEMPLPFYMNGTEVWERGTSKDGQLETRPVCEVFLYPTHRVRLADGTICMEFRVRLRRNDDRSWKWLEINVPTNIIGGGGAELAKYMASYEIVKHQRARKESLQMYMQAWMDKLRTEVDEVKAATSFGWQSREEFVLGDTAYLAAGGTKSVRLGGSLAVGYGKAFDVEPTGSADEWSRLVKKMYGHPGHEQYQFVLAASMASPLVELLGIEMGAPINLYGARGKGKTTVCQMALSVWGDPKQMQIADPKEGTTSNALYARMSTMHNLPTLIDEVTKLNADELGALAYHVCNAKPKDSLDQSRRRRDPMPPWYSVNFMTSNDSAQDKIASGKADASAQLSRFMEIDWSGDVQTITPYEMNSLQFDIEQHYGSVGPVLAQYYVEHREELRQLMMKTRERMDARLNIGKENRFWSIQVAAVVTFLVAAKRIGNVFPFEPKPIIEWLVGQVATNVAGMYDRVATMEDAVHTMITSMSNRTIATSTEMHANGSRMEVRLTEAPMGRVILDKGLGYYDINQIRTWCANKFVNMHSMRKWLEDHGHMVDSNARFTLGRGTTMITGQSRCWAINYFKLMGIVSEKEVPSYLKVVK